MKLAVLFSGGKDSCLALHKVLQKGHEVKYLLNIYPKNPDSFMFHKQNLELLNAQVKSLGIKIISVKSDGIKEKELDDLRNLIERVKNDVEGIVIGGIASSYQGKRIKRICGDLNLKFIAPLWNYEPEKLWEDLLGEGFEVVMVKIACDGLGKEWLGRVINRENFGELKKLSKKYKFRLDFEGGEAETAVLFMPGYDEKIDIDFDIESEGEYCHLMRNITVASEELG